MANIFKRIKKHFVLSTPDPVYPPHWKLSELLASPGSDKAYDMAQQKLSHAKKMLQTAASTTDYSKFQTAIQLAKADIEAIIPYERDLLFSGTSPSEMLQTIAENEHRLKAAFEKRLLLNTPFDQMTGPQFEQFCALLLTKNGYTNVKVTRQSKDQGIDIIAVKNGLRYGIQCKCYSSNVGNKAVQEAFTGAKFYDCQAAVVMTNRDFTKAAKELAYKNGVLLWNRTYLKELLRTDAQ